jgi:2-amino-4-hydroxy-6-hydroxymethyldihydropteridine diphosphokinase
MLDALLAVERRMGRIRGQRWGPRVIDLDLVWMVGTGVDDPRLKLPHPGVSMRNFVLYPLSDIAPTLDIPGHGRVLELKRALGGDGISLLE